MMVIWKVKCIPRVIVWIQLIVEKHFEDPELEDSQLSRDITWASLTSHATAAIIASTLNGASTTRERPALSKVPYVLHFLPHGDTPAFVDTKSLDDVDQDEISCIPVRSY
jgi:hypothetical protein